MTDDRSSTEGIARFGQWLVNRGLVEESDIIEALNEQHRLTMPVGSLALRERLLSMKQVFSILNNQVDTPERFGETAVRLGYLTEAQVGALLELQRKSRPPIGELLVRAGLLDRDRLVRELSAFHERQMGRR